MGVARHVNQNVSQAAIHQPGRHTLTVNLTVACYFLQCNFKLINLIVACFIHTGRLAGGANEHAAEQVAEAGMVVPIQKQAGQNFWTS